MWKPFRALPSYYGGKQKLARTIFKYMLKGEDLILFDGFMGAGSISLYGKAKGYKVIANDWAFIPAVIGHAVITNNDKQLTIKDVMDMLLTEPDEPDQELQEYMQKYFLEQDIDILNRLRAYAKQSKGIERWQAYYLMYMFMAKLRPFGGDLTNKVALKEYKQGYIDTHVNDTKIKLIRTLKKPRLEIFESIIAHYNRAVMPGKATFINDDIFQTIKRLKYIGVDIIYLDPPYTGADPYEKIYATRQWILTGEKPDNKISQFNKQDGIKFLEKLAKECEKTNAKQLILSFWTEIITAEELEEIFNGFNLKQIPIKYRYVYGTAKPESGQKEFLGVGYR